MKKIMLFVIAALALGLASCTTQKSLYSWANYPTSSYNYLKNSDEKSTQELIETYQKIIEKQEGTRGVVPPGIYADYGFLLLTANKTEEGKALLDKEIALYPESKVFIDRILKMMEE
ncbi:MAG TPA: DUF4810 domain-containing protein [Porphyromonadaceae bacterium]|jgi:hypothetical protein|nr:DUF4810 domain-containing protein [Porphyromonadaceae bacterium]HBK31300.1 DUF4810 domain-containing protein [Porphyromonadaceae bacterium]HBX20931.1 DUF4810 domain-containing protein [Porphyromonadaceae bacterium]HCM19670.1 DUF4810 domain-containing protein [Porphyromonadaceae bacterium]